MSQLPSTAPAEYLGQNSTLQGSCYQGGHWYLCRDLLPKFLGCCDSDPCTSLGCPIDDLRSAFLGPGAGPDACQNDSSLYPNVGCPTGSAWYSCWRSDPPFQGCCSIDPCDVGSCPKENLSRAFFVKKNVPPYAKDCDVKDPPQTNVNVPGIVGGAIGAIILLATVIIGIFYWRRRKKSRTRFIWSKAFLINLKSETYNPPTSVSSSCARNNIENRSPQVLFNNFERTSHVRDEGRTQLHELDAISSPHPVEPDGGWRNDTSNASINTPRSPGRNTYRFSGISEMTFENNEHEWSHH